MDPRFIAVHKGGRGTGRNPGVHGGKKLFWIVLAVAPEAPSKI